MSTPFSAAMAAAASPSEPFLQQIQRLEEKLRRAQEAAPFTGAVAATPQSAEAATLAHTAASAVEDVQQILQSSLAQRSEGLSRANEGLSQRVAHLDRSLRQSEALRKRESAQRSDELQEVKMQLSSELRTRRSDDEASPDVGGGGSPGTKSSREWRLRADLAEATRDLQVARSQQAAEADEHTRVSSDLAARAATATQGVVRLQEEVRASLGERQALMAQVAQARSQVDDMRQEVRLPPLHPATSTSSDGLDPPTPPSSHPCCPAASLACSPRDGPVRTRALQAAQVVVDKSKAAESVAKASAVVEAARQEAAEARKQAATAARSEQAAREEEARRRGENVSEATRAAAGAVAAAQAQAARTMQRVNEATTRREAELSATARDATARAASAMAECAVWHSRCSHAERAVGELTQAVATYQHSITPCTAEQVCHSSTHLQASPHLLTSPHTCPHLPTPPAISPHHASSDLARDATSCTRRECRCAACSNGPLAVSCGSSRRSSSPTRCAISPYPVPFDDLPWLSSDRQATNGAARQIACPSTPFHALPRPSTPFHALPCPSTPFHALPRPSTPFL